MGNSCTRPENQIDHSTHSASGSSRGYHQRGGNSDFIDIDMLLEASTTSSHDRRRRNYRAKSHDSAHAWPRYSFGHGAPIDLDMAVELSGRASEQRKINLLPKQRRQASSQINIPIRSHSRPFDKPPISMPVQRYHSEEYDTTYHSYEDPGIMLASGNTDDLDNDCILGGNSDHSSPNSPSVIHARWGEPVDDPDEQGICTEYKPNPFKLGFCVNCQKQHDVTAKGDVVEKKEYKKITRGEIGKYAANAENNPLAVRKPTLLTSRSSTESTDSLEPLRESEVDLTKLLQQRRDILLKLNRFDAEQVKRMEAATKEALKKQNSSNRSQNKRRTVVYSGSNDGSRKDLLEIKRVNSLSSSQNKQNRSRSLMSPRTQFPHSRSANALDVGVMMEADESDEPAKNDWL